MINIKLFALACAIFMFTSCVNNSSEDPDPEVTFVVQDFTTFIDQNPSDGQELGSIVASTSTGSLSFTLRMQEPEGAISVDAATGLLSVADASLFVFDLNPSISATVQVSNGTSTEDAKVLINVNEPEGESFTVWSGANITFSKADGADPSLEENQDKISDNVWLTRADKGVLYNAKVEASATSNPAGTEWAVGTIDQLASLTFGNLKDVMNERLNNLPGTSLVLHLLEEDVYLQVDFTSWSTGGKGGFSYSRATE